MREIGTLPSESDARIFGDYLYVQGISNKIEVQKAAGQQEAWIEVVGFVWTAENSF